MPILVSLGTSTRLLDIDFSILDTSFSILEADFRQMYM